MHLDIGGKEGKRGYIHSNASDFSSLCLNIAYCGRDCEVCRRICGSRYIGFGDYCSLLLRIFFRITDTASSI